MNAKCIAVILPALMAVTPSAAAEGFSDTLTDPSIQIDIPKLLPIDLALHPLNSSKPHLRQLGAGGGYTVSVMVPSADSGMTAEDCMRSRVPAILKSFGVGSDQVILKKPYENTYALIFILKVSPPQMQGYLFGKAETDHCIEVHISEFPQDKNAALSFAEMMLSGRIISPAPNRALQGTPQERRP